MTIIIPITVYGVDVGVCGDDDADDAKDVQAAKLPRERATG